MQDGARRYLLHVSQHVLPAVEHSSAFFRVQLVDEVRGVVHVGVLVPKRTEGGVVMGVT